MIKVCVKFLLSFLLFSFSFFFGPRNWKDRFHLSSVTFSVFVCYSFLTRHTNTHTNTHTHTHTHREKQRDRDEERSRENESMTMMMSSTTPSMTTTLKRRMKTKTAAKQRATTKEVEIAVKEQEVKEEHRTMCYSCFRKENLCICRLCERVLLENTHSKEKIVLKDGLHVSILQDRDEFRRKLGSAHIARNIVENCDVVWRDCSWPNALSVPRLEVPRTSVAVTEDENKEYEMVLLWPSENGQATSIEAYKKRNVNKKTHIIVLDSTWYKAKRMYNRIPWLKDLPCISLQNIKKESMYEPIRKQPFRDALSTAESIALALKEFGNADAELINVAFSEMIREQLQEEKRHERAVRTRERRKM